MSCGSCANTANIIPNGGLNPRGTWSSTKVYEIRDTVVYNSITYDCIIGNLNKQPDINATYWELFSNGAGGGIGSITGAETAPSISTVSLATSGLFDNSGNVGISYSGSKRASFNNTDTEIVKRIKTENGSAASPAFTNTGGLDGFYTGTNLAGITTGGVSVYSTSNTAATHVLPLTINGSLTAGYNGGAFGSQIKLKRSDGASSGAIWIDSSNHLNLGSNSGGTNTIVMTADSSTSGLLVHPSLTSRQNCNITLQKGNGASSYTTLFAATEVSTTSSVPLLVTSTTQSTSSVTGCAILSGGLGVAKDFFLAGSETIAGNLTVTGTTATTGATSHAGAMSITDATQSTSSSTGCLKLTGGLGVGKNLYIGGVLGNTGAATFAIQQTGNALFNGITATDYITSVFPQSYVLGNNTPQNLTNNAWTALNLWNAASLTTQSSIAPTFSGGVFTSQATTSDFLVQANVTVNSGGSATTLLFGLSVNGAVTGSLQEDCRYYSGSTTLQFVYTARVTLSLLDTVRIMLFQNSGGTLTCQASTTQQFNLRSFFN
jgi:hypothetical protein